MNGSATWRDKVFQKLDPDTGDLLQFRMCSSCRRPSVPLGESKKTCSKCREKQKRQQAKAKLAAAELEGENTHSQFLKSGFPDRGLKRKPEKTLQGLEGEQPRRALKMMKHALNDAIRTPSVEPVRTTVHTEYQKASSLYDAVKLAASANIVCNFAGCHSIVRSNVIDNNKRTQLVAKDLRKIVRIPFKYDVPVSRVTSSIKARVCYSCACRSSNLRTLSMTSSSSRGSFSTPTPLQVSENIDTTCGGSVVITVRDDDSHPLGILGQQIIVQIIH